MTEKVIKEKMAKGMQKLCDYINTLDRKGRRDFQVNYGLSISYIRTRTSSGGKLGSDYCMIIEEATNRAIRCEDLRPDLNWAFIRKGK